MLRWLVDMGGLEAAEKRSRNKSSKLYKFIESSGFYTSPLAPGDRSQVTVRFHLPDQSLERMFLDEAAENEILYLGGHPSVGGMRANLYTGVPECAVDTLIEFMHDFQQRRG
jgi:phosphoserine aminotransferase